MRRTAESIDRCPPDNADVWKTFSAVLHERHRDLEVLALRQRMPRKVAAHLIGDYDYVAVLASAENAAGNSDSAMRILNGAIARAKSSDALVPASLELQLSWLLLESPPSHAELFTTLERLQARPDLTAAESHQLADLWSTWISRTADQSSASGDLARAPSLLEQGARMFPEEPRLRRSLAGYLLKAGETNRALNVYKNWGLNGGTTSDYAGAIGAAMDQRDTVYANAWMREALAKWPSDPQLLNMAGKQAAATGDYKRAKAYWEQALSSAQQPQPLSASVAGATPVAPVTTSLQLRQLLLGNSSQPADSSSLDGVGGQPIDARAAEAGDQGWTSSGQRAEAGSRTIADLYSDGQVRMASYNPDSNTNWLRSRAAILPISATPT